VNRICEILLAVLLVLGPVIVTATPVSAGGATVDVPGDFSTIQEAIDVAQPGDTVRVQAGEYDGFLVIGKTDLSIIGEDGAVVTTGDLVSINRGPIEDAWTMAAVKDSQSINIQGIDFDGAGLSELDGYREVVVGIAYVNSTGRISDLAVDNTTGTELGVGVAVIGDAGTPSGGYGSPADVRLAQVTITNSMAGVIIWDAAADLDGCFIAGMQPNGGFGIMYRGVGIVVGIPGEDWRGPSTARVKGSTISDNNDIGIYVCDDSILEAHFNNIVDNALFGVLNDGGQRVDATHNWWGHADGPFPPRANAVSDDVDFIPWVPSPTVTETVTDGTVDARDEADTEVEVKGTATVTITRYLADPSADVVVSLMTQGEYVDIYPVGKWIDVYVPDVWQLEELQIKLYYTADELGEFREFERHLRLFWWDGTEWVQCSDSGINTAAGYIWAKIRTDTTPSLTDLEGTPFGGYGSPPPVPGWCLIATAAYGTDAAEEIDILREFRDTVLMRNTPGAGLVSLYYRTSPPVAGFISQNEVLRTAVRVGFVDPIVAVLNWTRDCWSTGWP